MVLVGLLTFIAFIFINNTIRLSITARRREIAIMRLVGASNGFIRGPFITEGVLQAILGSLLSIGVLELLRNLMVPRLQESIGWMSFALPMPVLPGDLRRADFGRRHYRSLWFRHRHAPLSARVGVLGIRSFNGSSLLGAARFLSPRDHLGRLLGCKRPSIVRRRHGAQ